MINLEILNIIKIKWRIDEERKRRWDEKRLTRKRRKNNPESEERIKIF